MTPANFDALTQEQIDTCLRVLREKAKEYAPGDDRLEHFKLTAAEQNTNPKEALWGMAAKHFSSLTTMCKRDASSKERWLEKITDSINYLLLLRALVEEGFENETYSGQSS